MSALTAIEPEFFDELAEPGTGPGAPADADSPGLPRTGLRLVEGSSESAPATAGRGADAGVSRGRPWPSMVSKPQPAAAPLRLTRRGRIVVVVLAVLMATALITLIGMALAGGAQASNHGRAGAGYQGMRQIVVQRGQTLWSIASRAEPSADPRLVISQIMTANSLTSTAVQAGQLLWVPK